MGKQSKKTKEKNEEVLEELLEETSEEVEEEQSEQGEEEQEQDPLVLKDEKIAALTDQIKRNMAEFDNFRKRTEKEKALMYEMGAKNILEKILPVVDNFERALAPAHMEKSEDKAFAKGIELIYKQLMSMLDELDVHEIEALHKSFDPDLHHAVAHEENDEYDENIVTNVMQKGYTYKDKVLRYAIVSVAN